MDRLGGLAGCQMAWRAESFEPPETVAGGTDKLGPTEAGGGALTGCLAVVG